MECTQRLECTQNVYETCSEKTCPEQIGFLGICGAKHPIKKGPNKVGRDPQTCGIVLNDNSISRQHAVINILNKKDFMLMDLDSSNKTKLLDKILEPYLPHPLKNGDTVQFGQVFGVFRLLEEDDDLPMTQAVEIPDTPVNIRHVSRLKTAQVTTIPESPDVSDRDDSVIAHSQPQNKIHFKSSNTNCSKLPGKVKKNQQVAANNIENVYWKSSKKSDSFNSNFENTSTRTVSKSSVSPKKMSVESSIYDMETQLPNCPKINETSHSIHKAETQVPGKCLSQSIYNAETQLPNIEKLPEVFRVQHQNNVQLNIVSTNKNCHIYGAETQVPREMLQEKENRLSPTLYKDKKFDEEDISKKLNSSDEEICFAEINSQQFDEECGSQPLLPPDPENTEQEIQKVVNVENSKALFEIHDSDSKDCEEIAPSQIVPEKPVDDEDVTDCEDNMIELTEKPIDQENKLKNKDDKDELNNDSFKNKRNTLEDNDLTDCEDDLIEISQNRSKANLIQNFEDLPTQVIGEELINLDEENERETIKNDIPLEDMLTQIIEECPLENEQEAHAEIDTEKPVPLEDQLTQVIESVFPQEQSNSTQTEVKNNSNLKAPFPSPELKNLNTLPEKKSKITKVTTQDTKVHNKNEDDANYYDATQEIYFDLCTQNQQLDLPEYKNEITNVSSEKSILMSERLKETREIINQSISNMSKEQVREVIGADTFVASSSKKICSDSSEIKIPPKKFNVSTFLSIDLPSTQEIKSCEFVSSRIDAFDSSVGFESSQELDNKNISPVGLHRKRRKKDNKLDLMKKFDIDTLPTRVIARIRKPTSKILDSDDTTKKMTTKILQSNLGLHNEREIDPEILELNLKRLRSKIEKLQNKRNDVNTKDAKKATSNHVEIEQSLSKSDTMEPKEFKIPLKSDKVLKQKNIKSMFKEPTSKGDKTMNIGSNKEIEPMNPDKSRRSSRNKNKGNKTEKINTEIKESKSDSSERKKSSSQTHSRKYEKEAVEMPEEEPVVRRSTRQRATKDKEDKHEKSKDKKVDKKDKSQSSKENKESNKSEILNTLRSSAYSSTDHSRVYNLSSESTVDSPTTLKRKATSEILSSKSKKSKSNDINAPVRVNSIRGNRTQYVLFTAFPCEEVKLKLEKLGAVMVSDVNSCTVVLTLQIRRTFKLLCAVGMGKPIVGPNWVQACADSSMIVDPWLYLMKDEATEKRFGFNLRQSLTSKRNFLRGHNVYCTPNCIPCAQEMKSIVECSGGTWKEGGRKWFCVSCIADKALWPELRRRGATLVSTEFILGGVLQQRINLDRDRIG